MMTLGIAHHTLLAFSSRAWTRFPAASQTVWRAFKVLRKAVSSNPTAG